MRSKSALTFLFLFSSREKEKNYRNNSCISSDDSDFMKLSSVVMSADDNAFF